MFPLKRFLSLPAALRVKAPVATFSTTAGLQEDPRASDLGKDLNDEYAVIRDDYATPKNPIVLAHGVLGFDELKLAGPLLPGIHYWRGIQEALMEKGIEVITTSVPPSGSIEQRAARLAETIEQKARGKRVNIVAGLDARYMISRLKPPNVSVLSLTTIATPHRGSPVADYVFERLGQTFTLKLTHALSTLGLTTAAFPQLTQSYMTQTFNPATPDEPSVRYFSYGAALTPAAARFSVFLLSHALIAAREHGAPNDGLVSVPSARWGRYVGTLAPVSHLELINWSNRAKLAVRRALWGSKHGFNALAFYLGVGDMLAKEGL